MTQPTKRLYRSRDDRMIAGVCSGLARYFDVDPTIVRLVFVLGLFLVPTSSFWIYLALALIVPEEPGTMTIVPPAETQRPVESPRTEGSEDLL